MKKLALGAILLAASTTPGLSICKHHATAVASVSDFSGASINPIVALDIIKKCTPNCGG
jgi:hypothetical protein